MTMNEEYIEAMFEGPHADFDDDELFDAFAIYQFLVCRKVFRNEDIGVIDRHCDELLRLISIENIWVIARQLGLKNVFEIRRFGFTLVNVEFRNPP